MPKISASLEDYLEGVLILEKKKDKVRVADLADLLRVKRPSVVKSLNKLKEQGLVVQEPYGAVEFTRKGKMAAEKVFERHGILRDMFLRILGIDKKIAEKDACGVEHVISPQTFERLQRLVIFFEQTEIGKESLKAFQQYCD